MINFKRITALIVIAILMLIGAGCGKGGSKGQGLYEQALAKQEQMEFSEAKKLYKKARPLLIKDGKTEEAGKCRQNLQTMELYELTYPYNEKEIEKALVLGAGSMPEIERKSWIKNGDLEHVTIDGKTRYFAQAADNVKYRYLEILRSNLELQKKYDSFILPFLENIVLAPTEQSTQPFEKPITYMGTETLNIPRDELPKTGVFKLWFPIPILTGPQDNVNVISVTPDKYMKQPPSIDREIGLIYMEVPLKSLEYDLNIQIQFSFTRLQQRFTIDPDDVGRYDKSGSEYKEYTRSSGNIYISPEIRKTARKIVGSEKNPYKAARKIYNYVIKNIKYSFMPHFVMWPRSDERESVYVDEMKRGDCGAQSIYFSALCRAVGIPARTTGGWQLFTGQFEDHFWAEFLLPNYGWIPVDPTAAEIADYVNDLSGEQIKAWKDFFFGSQDAFRCVVQKDVDVPLIPQADEMVVIPLAIQFPAALCSTMNEIPGVLVEKYWKLEAVTVPQ